MDAYLVPCQMDKIMDLTILRRSVYCKQKNPSSQLLNHCCLSIVGAHLSQFFRPVILECSHT